MLAPGRTSQQVNSRVDGFTTRRVLLIGRHQTPHRHHRPSPLPVSLIHIAGNLVVFLGPAAFNSYAYTLESEPAAADSSSSCCCPGSSIHIYKTVRMSCGNQQRAAGGLREEEVGGTTRPARSFASSTMIVSGLWLLVFLRDPRQGVSRRLGPEYEMARRRARSLSPGDGDVPEPADGRAST